MNPSQRISELKLSVGSLFALQYPQECEFLVHEYQKLSGIAHHENELDEEIAKHKLETVEQSLKKLTYPQTSIIETDVSSPELPPSELPPISSNVFKTNSIDEVIKIIKTSTPNTDVFSYDDDLIPDFEVYVANNVFKSTQKSIELKNVHPSYQHNFLHTVTKTIDQKNKISWVGILPLITYLIKRCNDDDNHISSFAPVCAIYPLLEKAFKEDLVDFCYKNQLWPVIEQLVEIGNKNLDNNEYPNDNIIDTFTISLNSLDGLSFHILYHYALWCEKHTDKKGSFESKVKRIFDNYLGKKENHTVSRHAVFGLYLRSFHRFNKSWFDQILDSVKDKKIKLAFWNSYICWNKLHVAIFHDLHEWYDEALNGPLVKTLNGHYKPNQSNYMYESTIGHMILAYLYNLDNADGYFEKFVKNLQNNEFAENCAFQLAHVMKDKTKDIEFNKEKLEKLWKDESFLKQKVLHLWFKNSPLNQKTTIQLYLNYLKQYPEKIDLVFVYVGELQNYVSEYPKLVIDCLKILVEKTENHFIPDEMKNILKLLLESKDTGIKNSCNTIIDDLAKLGYNWKDLLV